MRPRAMPGWSSPPATCAVGLAGNGCITLPSRLLGVEPRTMLRIARTRR